MVDTARWSIEMALVIRLGSYASVDSSGAIIPTVLLKMDRAKGPVHKVVQLAGDMIMHGLKIYSSQFQWYTYNT